MTLKIFKIFIKLLFYLLIVVFIFVALIPLIADGRKAFSDAIDQAWMAFWIAMLIWFFAFRFFVKKILDRTKFK